MIEPVRTGAGLAAEIERSHLAAPAMVAGP
jgi:hypothetical protein